MAQSIIQAINSLVLINKSPNLLPKYLKYKIIGKNNLPIAHHMIAAKKIKWHLANYQQVHFPAN
jgi:hypothetical protein